MSQRTSALQPSKRAPDQDRQRNEKLLKFLAQPLLLEEAGPPRLLSQLLLVVSLMVAGALVFAGFTKISALGVEEQRVNVILDLEAGQPEAERLEDECQTLVENSELLEPQREELLSLLGQEPSSP